MRIDVKLVRVIPDEGAIAAFRFGRLNNLPNYWWVGPDGTRYYTPPLRGRRVGVMENGERYVMVDTGS